MKHKILLAIACLIVQIVSAQWIQVNTGLGSNPPSSMFAFADTVYLGTDGDGVFRTLNNGANWTNISGNLGNLSINDIRPGVVSAKFFVSTAGGPFYSQSLGNYVNCTSTGLTNTDVRYFWFGGDDPNDWAIGTNGGGVFVADEMTGPWIASSNGLSGNGFIVNDMGGYSDASTEYAVLASDGGVYFSSDNLITWIPKNNGLTSGSLEVKGLAGLGSMIQIATRDGFFMSTDLGNTWIEIIPDEKLNVVFITVSPLSSTGFFCFVFGENGFYSEDFMTFYPIDMEGLPGGEVTCAATTSTQLFIGIAAVKKSENGIFRQPLDQIVGIREGSLNGNGMIKMISNYPNPFSVTTSISYIVPRSGFVTLKIYNPLGQEVTSLINQNQRSGSYSVDFRLDGTQEGIFTCVLNLDGKIASIRKMVRILP